MATSSSTIERDHRCAASASAGSVARRFIRRAVQPADCTTARSDSTRSATILARRDASLPRGHSRHGWTLDMVASEFRQGHRATSGHRPPTSVARDTPRRRLSTLGERFAAALGVRSTRGERRRLDARLRLSGNGSPYRDAATGMPSTATTPRSVFTGTSSAGALGPNDTWDSGLCHYEPRVLSRFLRTRPGDRSRTDARLRRYTSEHGISVSGSLDRRIA